MKVHFIAIGGTGMGALAILLQQAGHEVRGSDTKLYPPMSDQLAAAGIEAFEGFAPENLDWGPEVVVVGNVCSKDHVEVLAARERGLRLESFPSLLEQTLLADRRSLVIAGTHGKTTTASMTAWLLAACELAPSWLIGGVADNLGTSSGLGSGPAIVLEGDEYDTAFFDKKSKFLHYRPTRAILTSVEFDHADIFADLAAVKAAFAAFVALIPEDGELVVCADSPEALDVASHCKGRVTRYRVVGPDDPLPLDADVLIRVLSRTGAGRMSFELIEGGRSLGAFWTSLMGRYNAGNFGAAIVLALREGASIEAIRHAVERFRGVKRRQELVGTAQGVRVVQDFAHHPTAVALTVVAMRRRFPEKRLLACFEPRSASARRAEFFAGYSKAFEHADAVYLAPLHQAHKTPVEQRLDTDALARSITANGVRARAFQTIEALRDAVAQDAAPGDTVLCMSSGDFGGLSHGLLAQLGDAVMLAGAEDLPAVNTLMSAYDLPAVVNASEVETLVMREPSGTLIGCVNLQAVGDDQAYLFGLAVSASRRGEGLGWILADACIAHARGLGVKRVVLLTSDAADFFANRFGFRRVEVEELDPAMRTSSNFAASYSAAATCMVRDFVSEPASAEPAPADAGR